MKRQFAITTVSLFAVMAMAVTGHAQPGGGPELRVETLTETAAGQPGGQVRAAVLASITQGFHVNAHEPAQPYLIPTNLTFEPMEGITPVAVVYPDAMTITLTSGQELLVYEEEFAIGVVFDLADGLAPGEYALAGKLAYQACDDAVCFPPSSVNLSLSLTVVEQGAAVETRNEEVFSTIDFDGTALVETPQPGVALPVDGGPALQEDGDWRDLRDQFEVTGQASGYINAGDFIAFVDAAERGDRPSDRSIFEGKNIFLIVLLTLGLGMLLNLTPCVLPIIPLNLAIIGAGAQGGSRMRGFALGGLYGLGIAMTYGILGVVVVVTSGAFGTINASPWFNLAIAVVFVVLALAMFDVLLIDFTKYQSKLGIKPERGSFIMALFMGCISALLAGACVAPVVIAVVLFAREVYAQGSVAGLALPFVLGLGMALPWPFAGGGLSFLPKPGGWMVWVKKIFGVIILALAAYYGWKGFAIFQSQYLIDENAVLESVRELDEEGWTASLAEGLRQAQENGQPVIIDFWATWCTNCITMNETTFKDQSVKDRLDNYVKIKYKAQYPTQAPASEVMDSFGVGGLGLPVYVIVEPR